MGQYEHPNLSQKRLPRAFAGCAAHGALRLVSYDGGVTIREATASDHDLLWTMLTYAARMDPGGAPSVAAAKQDPELAFYVAGFGSRRGDLGVVATDGTLGCGAAWLRLSDGVPLATKVATASEPELAIAIIPERRGAGLGAQLLEDLIARARGRYPAITLSVREDNPSSRLYARFGFVVTASLTNRVGGRSIAMRLSLDA